MSHGEALILLGVAIGVVGCWRLARSVERYRRARVDLRSNLDNIRGSWERARAEGVRMAKYAGVTLLVVGALIVAAIAKGHAS